MLQYLENGWLDLGRVVIVVINDIRRYIRPIIFFLFLYLAKSGLASLALNLLGDSLSNGVRVTLLDSLNIVYNTAAAGASVIVTLYLVYVFSKICLYRHFTDWDNKLAKIMSGLEEEGILVTYIHTQEGYCCIDFKQVLNNLVTRNDPTDSTRELYWKIRDNYELLSRSEFFPLGKPKTPVQILTERLARESAATQ